MGFRFEFDRANKILLLRVEGRLTDESLAEVERAAQKYWVTTDPSAGIVDFSPVTEFAVSTEFLREMAKQKHPFNHPRFIVAPTTHVFGLARMFQILGGSARPGVNVVRTMDEAFAALGVQSLHFQPLD
jgi:hypothetical protein